MIELARLYFLACELKPLLPDHRLMKTLPPKHVELITSAAKNGISSGIANYEMLATLYEAGAKFGIDPTEEEFKSLMTGMINEHIEKKEIAIDEKLNLLERLVRYYKQGMSYIPQVRRKFNAKAPPFSKFATGFEPLDIVLGGGAYNDVVTVMANPGTGKSYLAMSIAATWPYGSVWFYDPESGEALILTRANKMDNDASFENKEFIFGYYNPEDILEEMRDNPDPNRLIIMDSLHFICGTGRDSTSGLKYEHAYNCAVAMKQFAKLIIITTQVKRGADGDSIDSAAASACIERHSGALIHLSKGMALGDGCYEYRMYGAKNRSDIGGIEVKFAFDYNKAVCRYMILEPVFAPNALEEMEYF